MTVNTASELALESFAATASRPSAPATPSGLGDWPPLEVYDVVKRWRKDRPMVLDGINLTLDAGELMWIGGRNGAGKTTLLRIIAGLIDPDQGEVRAFGMHPVRQRRDYQRSVGFLSAGNSGIYARLTVRGQLDCWARIAYIPRARRPEAVQSTLERFDLLGLADHRSDRLSMGQRQRLRLAMTFIAEPDVVLLDEPLNSLDGEGAAILEAAILDTAARGGAVLWCSPTGERFHNIAFTQSYLLEQGKLVRA